MVADLLPPDLCVVCFHDNHENGTCMAVEVGWPVGAETPCGCTDYVTEAERGTREVYLDDPGGEA